MTTSLLGHFSAGIIIFYKLLWLVRTDQGYVQSANFYKGIQDLLLLILTSFFVMGFVKAFSEGPRH